MKWPFLILLAGALCGGAGPLWAGDGARLFFSKAFPGSTPAYMQVALNRDGGAEYREAADDDQPLKFHLSEAETQEVFDLAAKLDYFKHPLESPAKVAFMGTKTLRFENGEQRAEVKFNYTEDASARMLVDWFERMAESAELRIELERAAKYDHLGVVKAVLLLEEAMENKRVVAQEQFLPMLDRIAGNPTYMHTAREHAAGLADAIRKTKP
jgi:hypothetical protein